MKTNILQKQFLGALLVMACAIGTSQAQQRGNNGGGFGGFGGFGGGGNFGGGNNSSRSSGSGTTGSYNNNGSVGSAIITVDPQTHNIVVIADEETSLQISNVLANLDKPKPQVLIKVVFLEVQRNNDSDIGIEGGYVNNKLGSGISGSAANVFGLAGANSVVTNFNGIGQPFSSSLTPNSSANGFYQIVGKDFQATLKAIASAGKAQVLSRPSVLARDGQLAKIVIGQQVYLPSGVTFTTTGSTTTPIINGNYTDIGIILNVTPFIGANGLVEMILQPQTSTVDTSSPGQQIATGGLLGSPVYAPNINIRSADTVVVTPDSQPVVIGGLISNAKSATDTKVPLLGDIPLLGNLFKSSKRSNDKTELLLFLTPHVVMQPGDLASLTQIETDKSQVITNSVSEQELNRFLERVPVKQKN